jgi:serine protease Do
MLDLFHQNKKLLGLVAVVAALSAIFSVAAYRFIEQRNYWSGQDDKYAQYSNFYEAVFSDRAQKYFQSSAPTNFTKAAAIAASAVVNIKASESGSRNAQGDISTSTGSGVIISPDGYIVTNNHVLEGSDEIEVALNDRRKFIAKVVGSDPSTDLALLKIQTQNLPTLVFGNSDSLLVGEWVLAVGNPFELNSTVTAGIVSAKARNINILEDASSIESFIQTDAVVNPGNSGGALVNTKGELVGINTAIITHSGQYEGYSFAIPSNLVQKIIRDIREFGVTQRGFLGINIEDMSDEMAKNLGLPSPDGVYVRNTTVGGASEEAGLRAGDVIVSCNGVPLKSMPELQELIGRFRPGNKVELEFLRDRNKQKASVILRNDSNATNIVTTKTERVLKILGIELRELSPNQKRKIPKGAIVNSVKKGSIVGSTNMEPGFVITKINGIDINNVQEAADVLSKLNGKVVVEGVYEGYEGSYYYTFRI